MNYDFPYNDQPIKTFHTNIITSEPRNEIMKAELSLHKFKEKYSKCRNSPQVLDLRTQNGGWERGRNPSHSIIIGTKEIVCICNEVAAHEVTIPTLIKYTVCVYINLFFHPLLTNHRESCTLKYNDFKRSNRRD